MFAFALEADRSVLEAMCFVLSQNHPTSQVQTVPCSLRLSININVVDENLDAMAVMSHE